MHGRSKAKLIASGTKIPIWSGFDNMIKTIIISKYWSNPPSDPKSVENMIWVIAKHSVEAYIKLIAYLHVTIAMPVHYPTTSPITKNMFNWLQEKFITDKKKFFWHIFHYHQPPQNLIKLKNIKFKRTWFCWLLFFAWEIKKTKQM